ncbi:hypothetical protein IC617_08470 [Neiella sp. HB171785]|uniref:Uncharacterized protein n=1 Tax=Neiella litorisoli TaxID=2771431 RepID=A0A8J6UEG9_9GAMM|nr:hypothetical protein [Neiella litorisoli]MBD1389459.1 hypothetical protein [Neiella litorisoli]
MSDVLSAYSVVEQTWHERSNQIEQGYQQALEAPAVSKNAESRLQDVHESFAMDFMRIAELEQLHREAMLIVLQNELEHGLNALCRDVANAMQSKIKFTDLNDRGIKRAWSYLKKVADFEFSSLQKEQSVIADVQEIRNIIVHAGGTIKDKKILAIVNKYEWFSGREGAAVEIKPEFMKEYVATLHQCLDRVSEQTQSFMERTIRAYKATPTASRNV